MKDQIETLINKYQAELSQSEEGLKEYPNSDYHIGREYLCHNIIDDLKTLLPAEVGEQRKTVVICPDCDSTDIDTDCGTDNLCKDCGFFWDKLEGKV